MLAASPVLNLFRLSSLTPDPDSEPPVYKLDPRLFIYAHSNLRPKSLGIQPMVLNETQESP